MIYFLQWAAAWYFSGLVSQIVLIHFVDKEDIKVGDLGVIFGVSLFGPLIWILVLHFFLKDYSSVVMWKAPKKK